MKPLTARNLRVFCLAAGLLVLGLFAGWTPNLTEPTSAGITVADSTGIAHTEVDSTAEDETPVQEATLLLHNQKPLTVKRFKDEMLWLARGIYSETKRTDEQFLVAWVIRNRVETRYRNKGTYKRVVLDPYQFSAFNPGLYSRRYFAGLDASFAEPAWQNALWIARRVMLADGKDRPFTRTTRHFYSERSMKGPNKAPVWSVNKVPVQVEGFEIDARRFRFYDKVI